MKPINTKVLEGTPSLSQVKEAVNSASLVIRSFEEDGHGTPIAKIFDILYLDQEGKIRYSDDVYDDLEQAQKGLDFWLEQEAPTHWEVYTPGNV